jgi:hypothetical protein
MSVRTLLIATLATGTAFLGGCADTSGIFGNSANLTTSSVAPAAAPKADPACVTLASQIDGLRKEGIAEKIEKASLKKYKMSTAELVKADQLNKANADFQGKCSTYKPSVAAVAPAAPAVAAAAAPAAAKAAAAAPAAAKAATSVASAAGDVAAAAKP